jgi:hypothetical protein
MISLSRQTSAAVPRLCNAIQLAFLDDPLVRFIGIFNTVLTVVAFEWQELRDLINRSRTGATERSRHKADGLTHSEFMLGHGALHRVARNARHLVGDIGPVELAAPWKVLLPQKSPRGAVSIGSIFLVNA